MRVATLNICSLSDLADSSIVITGMDIEPLNNTTAFSWTKQAGGPAFDGSMHTVSIAALSGAVAAEGQLGRVVTAISYNNGQASFMSYGWQGNGQTIYETSVQTSSITNAASVASDLAASGYIVTAMGGSQFTGVLLVGTRVAGDSLARPILVIPANQSPYALGAEGYALVGFMFSVPTGFVNWIGEK